MVRKKVSQLLGYYFIGYFRELALRLLNRLNHFNAAITGFVSCRHSPPEMTPNWITSLVAPYCAIPRDYLSDTPLLRAMGFLVSQHGQLGAIPPPPFLSISPLESMQSGGAIPPPEKRYLSDTCAIPYENKANGCDTPLCDTISKGYCAIWGVSRTGPLRLHLRNRKALHRVL